MQNKERLLELQTIFSRRHIGLLVALLLFMGNNLVLNNNFAGLKYLLCVIICAVLLVDMFFAYFSFFHKYILLVVLRLCEMGVAGFVISDAGSTGVGGMSDVFAVLFYAMFMIESVYLYDLTDNANKIKVAFLGQICFMIKAVGTLAAGGEDYTTHALYYVIMGMISFMIMWAISEYCGKMQEYYDKCVFSKDRMLDQAKDNSDKIYESQKTIREANEQLGIKKFELEDAYRKINIVNADNDFQNRFMRLVLSSYDLKLILSQAEKMFKDTFKSEYCGIIFIDEKLRTKYGSGIYEFFNENDLMQFTFFFLSDAFLYEHKDIGSHFVQDEISYDEFPFFKEKKVNSVAIKAFVPDIKNYSCIYVMFSNEYNVFKQKTVLLDNVFGVMEMVARNLTSYYKVEEMSVKDALSGLYNRRYLNLYFDKNFISAVHEGEVTLAMLDIDHFKSINDTYGHLFGDQAIRAVSELIIRCAGKYKGTGFRYGGEEFVLIFENKTLDETVNIIEELRTDIRNEEIKNDMWSINVRVSAGVASYPETTDKISSLVDRADKAMYYSKQNGRDRMTVDGTYEGEE